MAGGSSGGSSSGGPKKARIEIIPLIDVVFFLLATFILFTLSLNKSSGVTVQLPQSGTSEPRDPLGTVTVSITEENAIAWDKDPISLDEFIIRLQKFKQTAGPDARILLNGDESALYSSARYVFDEIRKVGINKVLIETRVAPAGGR
ncbi:biopolymer transporter ExbD [Nibricoccus aquaticus]|uniref:Biopolymer transporter ExbD n=1 Tax=Nibricoccus aquaticus TaxID=2576891 RepID=A0A290Q2R8_9BACT|nr:biopolymer transporter ExbD [Nibricoccus aquaticus]ATC62713.1 biopolymer transporter ExbD [Nibricoccus aquaticus]